MKKVLAINPGSTSTKIAVFEDATCQWKTVIEHPAEELKGFNRIFEQYAFRQKKIRETLEQHELNVNALGAVVGRGGILNPLLGGTYLVDEFMVEALQNATMEHASNLGGILAYSLAKKTQIPAFIVNPVTVDEMEPIARLSGHPELPRYSLSHALNMKAVARKAADQLGRSYEEINLIVAHLGTGISIAPHKKGRMVDVNNANNEGPFAPERCGTVPAISLAKLCFSGKYSETQVVSLLNREGGLYAYLGTKDVREVEKRINAGDEYARLVLDALIYQVGKEIGAMATVLAGQVDQIVLTGGLAYSDYVTQEITNRVQFIAPIGVFPGEEEMEALALGALRVLNGEEQALIYKG